jgi:hypothetical protein
MKTKTLSVVLSVAVILFCSMVVRASDQDSTIVEKKIVKIIRSDDKGTTIIDSTITTENGKSVVHVDTTSFNGMPHHYGGPRHMMKEKHMMLHNGGADKHFEMEVQTDDDSTHVTANGKPLEEIFDMFPGPDSFPCHEMMELMNEGNGLPEPPSPPVPPIPSFQFSEKQRQGFIDLNDPSIIRYEKKIQKDGTEKITIIRKMQ